MKTRTDKTLMILTALFVGGLAVVAGAGWGAVGRARRRHRCESGRERRGRRRGPDRQGAGRVAGVVHARLGQVAVLYVRS